MTEISNKLRDLLDDPEVFALMATCAKKQFDAYVRVGFSKEQALHLMSHRRILVSDTEYEEQHYSSVIQD